MVDRPGNSLAEWYPLVRGLAKTPVTVILHSPDLTAVLDPEAPDTEGAEALQTLVEQVQSAGDAVGWPIFLRTGHTSAKHGWADTCFVPSKADVEAHVLEIVNFSLLADFPFGLPSDVWVVREMLRTVPAFHAFGGMPVTRERRFFIKDGAVIGWHPYWPPDAIKDPDTEDWVDRLASISKSAPEELERLTSLNQRVATAFQTFGAWSVDWLWTDRGWFLIDMARAEESYVWWDYPSAPIRGAFEPDPADVHAPDDAGARGEGTLVDEAGPDGAAGADAGVTDGVDLEEKPDGTDQRQEPDKAPVRRQAKRTGPRAGKVPAEGSPGVRRRRVHGD